MQYFRLLFRLVLAAAYSVFTLTAGGQTTISGTVINSGGETLPGANIYLKGTYTGTTSTPDGIFIFTANHSGTYTLRVDYLGFQSFEKELELSGNPVNLNIKLKETFNKMEAVTIKAGTFEAGDRKRSVEMTALDMVTVAGAMGDVYGALQALPGTTVNGESGKLFVKGGDSEESQTFIDGSLVYVPYGSSPPQLATRGRFDPFMFKGTVFNTGGYSAGYGQALSSVLLLNTTDMPEQNELNISLLTVGGGLAGTKLWNGGAITASFSYSNLKPYMALMPQNYSWNSEPQSFEGAVSIRQKTGKTGMLKFYGSAGNSEMALQRMSLNGEHGEFSYGLKNTNRFINLSWKTPLAKKWSSATAASYTFNNDAVTYGGSSMQQRLNGIHIRQSFTYDLTDRILLRTGSEIFHSKNEFGFSEDSLVLKQTFESSIVAGYAEAEIYYSSKFVTRMGGRIEYAGYPDHLSAAPRFSAAYKLTRTSQFSLAYGWFYQLPPNDVLRYTQAVKPERADHYIFSYQSSVKKRLLRGEIFYKDYRQLIKYQWVTPSQPEGFSNTGSGYAYGLDVFFRDAKTIKGAEFWISYGYLMSERNYRDFPYAAIPSFVSRHNISVVYKQWIGPLRTLAGGSYRFASPRVYNDPNLTGFNTAKMPAYHTLDLNLTYLHRENIIFYAAVSNVPGFKHSFGYRYAATPGEDGSYAGEEILPSAERFFVVACFITLSKSGDANQLDEIQ